MTKIILCFSEKCRKAGQKSKGKISQVALLVKVRALVNGRTLPLAPLTSKKGYSQAEEHNALFEGKTDEILLGFLQINLNT